MKALGLIFLLLGTALAWAQEQNSPPIPPQKAAVEAKKALEPAQNAPDNDFFTEYRDELINSGLALAVTVLGGLLVFWLTKHKSPSSPNENPVVSNPQTQTNTNQQTVNLNPVLFDASSLDALQKLITALQPHPGVLQQLEVSLNTKLDSQAQLTDQVLSRFGQLEDLIKASQGYADLEEKLRKTNESNEALEQELEQLRKKHVDNPDYQELLAKAEAVLDDKDYQRYHQIIEEFSTKQELELGELAHLRAKEYHNRLQYRLAYQQIKKATRFAPDNTDYWFLQGKIAYALGDHEQYLAISRHNLARIEQAQGKQHPDYANTLNNLGEAYRAKGEYDQAIDFYQQALAIFEKRLGTKHPHTELVRTNLQELRNAI